MSDTAQPHEGWSHGVRPRGSDTAAAIAELKPLLGDRLVTSRAVREHHAKDMSYIAAAMPDAVAFPQTEAEVQAIVKACAAHKVPVVPYGAGSSMEGHTIPRYGGISIDTREMRRILEI